MVTSVLQLVIPEINAADDKKISTFHVTTGTLEFLSGSPTGSFQEREVIVSAAGLFQFHPSNNDVTSREA